MRKIITIICILSIVVLSTCFSFAAEYDESVDKETVFKYVDANYAKTQLAISGNTAYCKTTVTTRSASTVNRMVVTVYYYKSGGTYVGSNTITVYSSNGTFIGTSSKSLSSHGTYYAEASVKLYHNSQLVESFTLMTGNATY